MTMTMHKMKERLTGRLRLSRGWSSLRATLVMAATLVVCCLLTASCHVSYTMNGSAINYDIYKTIRVGEFPIRAALVYPPLQQVFENKLQDVIQSQTRLSLVSTNNPDLEMTGEITGYQLTPQAVGENAYATQTRLTITVKVKYIDHRNDANNVESSFSAYRDFDATLMLTDVQDGLIEEISTELVDLIFNATLGNW